MKTQHTPGPWQVVELGVISEKITTHGNFYVASIPFPDNEEDKANAKLIAAAPELLEALESLTTDKMIEALGIGFAAIISKNRKSQYSGHSFEEKSLLIEKAIAAINKAKGE